MHIDALDQLNLPTISRSLFLCRPLVNLIRHNRTAKNTFSFCCLFPLRATNIIRIDDTQLDVILICVRMCFLHRFHLLFLIELHFWANFDCIHYKMSNFSHENVWLPKKHRKHRTNIFLKKKWNETLISPFPLENCNSMVSWIALDNLCSVINFRTFFCFILLLCSGSISLCKQASLFQRVLSNKLHVLIASCIISRSLSCAFDILLFSFWTSNFRLTVRSIVWRHDFGCAKKFAYQMMFVHFHIENFFHQMDII